MTQTEIYEGMVEITQKASTIPIVCEDSTLLCIPNNQIKLTDLLELKDDKQFVVNVYLRLLDILPEDSVIQEGVDFIHGSHRRRREFIKRVMKNELYIPYARQYFMLNKDVADER